ncbi:site-2 protease family protein [Aerosakkonema funiforme]|uniref:Site-2 protease family protein n=1 Tax=Aerosakkonema funiforme FACHB-1375 TaxID=2949571 RepID=A0A926ZJ19_9CYAN|nr:site-2 protease family protein [Aerosakkonema funiforme]MBD2184179.1 site-2 protease family protein [Aerosakkonema funiforme FACHB-1375]
MFTASETSVIALILLAAFGILAWGYLRAKPFGKLGILAWLQSVALMAPWLLFFGLFAAGIYLNLVSILFMLVASAGLYIYLGRQLRAAGQDLMMRDRAAKMANANQEASSGEQTPQAIESATEKPQPVQVQLKIEFVPIPQEDLKTIQGIFGIDTFFATETIPYQEGAVFNGNLRGEAQAVHTRLSDALQERLGDRYRLFLIENPEGKPVVVVLPSRNDPKPSTIIQKILAVVLMLATIATCLETSGLMLEFDLFQNPSRLAEALPIGLGILTILVAHEIGHWLLARRHNIRLSLPYFIPTLQIGSFGAITRFESLLPNRNVLFDISVAGPAAGGIVSLLMLIVGMLLSQQGSFFQVPAQFFQGSILVGTLARVVLGSALQQPLVDVHPLVVIGWLGLVITALNLMPAGQLDGGRIVLAIYGRKVASRTTIATLIVLALVALGNPLAIYWAIVIVFLQRDLERPSLNEISEPDDARAAIGLLALFLTIATLIPLSPGLAGRLGIGVSGPF